MFAADYRNNSFFLQYITKNLVIKLNKQLNNERINKSRGSGDAGFMET